MSEGTAFAVCVRDAWGTHDPMKNVRFALAAFVVTAGALAWPLRPAAGGAVVSPDRPPAASAIERANARVDEALVTLPTAESEAPVTVVRVVGAPLRDLLADPEFLGNVHRLQTFLNEHDAGPLVGTDVSVTEVLAVELADDGRVVLYTR